MLDDLSSLKIIKEEKDSGYVFHLEEIEDLIKQLKPLLHRIELNKTVSEFDEIGLVDPV